MLTSLGAGDLIGRKYRGLSQGEKQICLIARSLMEEPDIIILDEATVGLDLFAREKLLRQIDRITSLPHAPLVLTSPTMLKRLLRRWTTSSYSVKEKSWHKDQKMISSHRKF